MTWTGKREAASVEGPPSVEDVGSTSELAGGSDCADGDDDDDDDDKTTPKPTARATMTTRTKHATMTASRYFIKTTVLLRSPGPMGSASKKPSLAKAFLRQPPVKDRHQYIILLDICD